MKIRLRSIVTVVVLTLALFALLFVGGTGSAVSAQKKQKTAAVDDVLDSGSHPCVGSRLYYMLDFGPNAGLKSRLFIPAAVHEHQVVDGHLFVTPEDVAGTQDEGKLVLFVEGIHGGDPGQLGTWHWANLCYTAD